MNSLFLIPARGGSKGIPHKNIKLLNGKPLIYYTIDIARALTTDNNICVSTDDEEIINIVEDYGLNVPFKRPEYLASDTAGTYEVIMHAISFYENKGIHYDTIILLQPTSPFRKVSDVINCINKYTPEYEMVVTVKQASSNPYYDCYEANESGYLEPSKGDGNYHRRQDAPKVYEYNGAVYIMNVNTLKKSNYSFFTKIGFSVMDDISSLDLDTMLDWKFAELLIKEGVISYEK